MRNAAGKNVTVIAADGKTAAEGSADSDNESIPVQAGVYVVNVGERTFKVAVK